MVRPTNRDVNPVRCKQTRGRNHQPNISLPIGNESKMFFPLEVDFALKSLINGTSIDLIGHQLTPHCRPRCLTFLAEAQRDRFVQELKLNQKRKKKNLKEGGECLWGEVNVQEHAEKPHDPFSSGIHEKVVKILR